MVRPIIFLAGPFGTKLEMRKRRDTLVALGWPVQARWIDEPKFTSDTAPSKLDEAPSAEYLRKYALIDYEDVLACDTFICFPGQGAGHHTELGIALAMDKHIIIIGEFNNVFHHLPHIRQLTSWDAFLATIAVSASYTEPANFHLRQRTQVLPQNHQDGARLGSNPG